MSGHRPFNELVAGLPEDRRSAIERSASEALAELDRDPLDAKFVIYHAEGGQFRWRLVTFNNHILAESAEDFADRAACLESIDALRLASATLAVEEAA